MDPISLRPLVPLLTLEAAPGRLAAWRVGQVLEAMVASDAQGGKVVLKVGSQSFEASTPLPLKAGTALQVTVEKGEGTQLLLRIAPPPEEALVATLLRAALPRAIPIHGAIAEVLAQLQAKGRPPIQPQQVVREGSAPSGSPPAPSPGTGAPPPGTTYLAPAETRPALTTAAPLIAALLSEGATPAAPLPPPMKGLLEQILALLPDPRRLARPEGLAEALRDSGVLLEARLAKGGAAPHKDLKALLLRLLSVIESETEPGLERKGLLAQTEGALARVQLHQLEALAARQRDGDAWSFELPARGEQGLLHPFSLRVAREGGEGGAREGREAGWSAQFDFTDPTWGRIRGRVALLANKVSATFWCENDTTAARFREHLDRLEARLRSSGFEVGLTQSFTGLPADRSAAAARPGPLLDEKA